MDRTLSEQRPDKAWQEKEITGIYFQVNTGEQMENSQGSFFRYTEHGTREKVN
ncbi:MAG TPA: hypothetical protein H9930_10540 [Candidatus Mediterraneibacter excrementipullorum]|nr:hypothetical protein [Candidatus Mediterraneibacter excrementipullorum]